MIAFSSSLWIDANSSEFQQWIIDTKRLTARPATLKEWTDKGLQMRVVCTNTYCRQPDGNYVKRVPTISVSDLKQHLLAGLSLEDLSDDAPDVLIRGMSSVSGP